MGLMDKVKAQATVLADKAQTGMQQGQVKLQEMQAGKQVDHLLRELGAYVFLSERDRTEPDSEAKVADLLSQLDALEAAGTPVHVSADPPPLPPPAPTSATAGIRRRSGSRRPRGTRCRGHTASVPGLPGRCPPLDHHSEVRRGPSRPVAGTGCYCSRTR
jgi:hypothetical protein